MNKNNQTTSTKCQYQAAASNPKWWVEDKRFLLIRINVTNKNVVPIITWRPWNPVVTKKVVPKILSLMENWAWEYSHICNIVNRIPNKIVISKDL